MVHQQRTLASELSCSDNELSCKVIKLLFGEQFQRLMHVMITACLWQLLKALQKTFGKDQ